LVIPKKSSKVAKKKKGGKAKDGPSSSILSNEFEH
jgi:hypothetical protein